MDQQILKELFYNDVFTELPPEVGEDGRHHGLYVIQNQVNYKFYVGKHTSDNPATDKYFGSGSSFKLSLRKYGKDNFKMKYFHWADNAKQLHDDEDEVIGIILDDIFDGNWKELKKVAYNLRRNQGHNPFSDETRRKLSLAHTGKVLSDEHRHKISIATSGVNHPMYGKKQSIDSIEKNRASQLGNKGHAFTGYSVGICDTTLIIRSGEVDLKLSGFDHSSVSKCVLGRKHYKSHKGYQWIRTIDKNVIDGLLNTRKLVDDRSIGLYNHL